MIHVSKTGLVSVVVLFLVIFFILFPPQIIHRRLVVEREINHGTADARHAAHVKRSTVIGDIGHSDDRKYC